jgi:crotonobetainyl-CoA:carnitine CoA-transferase CaiB-like acyl-CoA transferase
VRIDLVDEPGALCSPSSAHGSVTPVRRSVGGPLSDIRVLDLTQVLSGPYATMLLADMGADVIKIEPPSGDVSRAWGPHLDDPVSSDSYGGYFASVNRNKRSVILDLHTASGVDDLHRLLATSDVLVENFRIGVMDRLDLSYESLHSRYPKLVYASIRGFGDPRTGQSPYADWPAFDIIAQAMGGILGITGSDPEQITKVGPGVRTGTTHRRRDVRRGVIPD